MKRKAITNTFPNRDLWGKFSLHRKPTSAIMSELIGLMQKESAPCWNILDSWRVNPDLVVLLDVSETKKMFSCKSLHYGKEPFLTSGFYTLPCVAFRDSLNPATVFGVWTAPGLRRQGFASALLSLLEPEVKFIDERCRSFEFIHRTCPTLAITRGDPEPVADYEQIECCSLFTGLLKGNDTLPRNKENCEILATLLNEKLGTGYYHFQWLDRCERGIECIRSPGWREEQNVHYKEVRFDAGGQDFDDEISLRFKWKNAHWSELERQMVIACFMKVFGFTELDPAFYKKQEIELLLASL